MSTPVLRKHASTVVVPTVQWGSLDTYQVQFCQSFSPNIRLLAPAGSGKTQSLLWRCAYVHQRQQGKARFLIVTFTRAARDELRARLSDKEFSGVSDAIEVATLNGWGYRRVRTHHHSPRLLTNGREKSWCIQNALQPVWGAYPKVADAMKSNPYVVGPVLMELVDRLKTLGFKHTSDDKTIAVQIRKLNDLSLTHLLNEPISRLHELNVLPNEVMEDFVSIIFPFWRHACQSMIDQSLFTLEDQKYVALLDLLRQQAGGKIPIGGSRISHVLVDEFQDINPLDLDLIKAIVDINKSELTIVGDDDQAIFEWRGATPSYILDPKEYFNRTFDTYILERNYRCPQNIVEASQRLIVRNTRRQAKRVEAMHPDYAQITLIEQGKFTDSIDAVMDEVRQFLKSSTGRAKLAIVSRKRAQLIPYQLLMASENLPFCAAEDLQVFMSTAFENLRKMLLICAKAKESGKPLSLIEEIVSLCDQVKRYPLKKSERDSLTKHLKASKPKSYADAALALSNYRGPLKGGNENGDKSHDFAARLEALLDAETVTEAINIIGNHFSGLEKDYGKATEDIFYVDPPFFYLAEFANRYGDDFGQFLDDLDTAKETLAQLPGEEDGTGGAEDLMRPVHLMTALRAKGKEFDTVIMLDVNDGIWPSRHAETVAQKEQERRLFYVAMTRAKRNLILTLSGRIGDQVGSPSPYLAESGLG